ncbi:MAG: PH domain-containing protein [Geobacteraceae bacterium]|nr:PH domain-containing protein [Geobacteraceae bacterium]
MEYVREFKAAAWPTSLKVVSCIGALLISGVSIGAIRVIPPSGFAHSFGIAVACLPQAALLGFLLFVVRGYRIDGGHLAIQRLLWTTSMPLLGIHAAQHDPLALKGALRIFGNGGLFGITGLYWNRALGRFRLFVTDPAKAVVLRLHDRIVVISPQEPAAFLQELERLFPRLQKPSEMTETEKMAS